MKVKMYKAKSMNGFTVIGFYYHQPSFTEYPIGDGEEPSMEHYMLVPTPGDWGLPYSMEKYRIDVSTLEEYDDVDAE